VVIYNGYPPLQPHREGTSCREIDVGAVHSVLKGRERERER